MAGETKVATPDPDREPTIVELIEDVCRSGEQFEEAVKFLDNRYRIAPNVGGPALLHAILRAAIRPLGEDAALDFQEKISAAVEEEEERERREDDETVEGKTWRRRGPRLHKPEEGESDGKKG